MCFEKQIFLIMFVLTLNWEKMSFNLYLSYSARCVIFLCHYTDSEGQCTSNLNLDTDPVTPKSTRSPVGPCHSNLCDSLGRNERVC